MDWDLTIRVFIHACFSLSGSLCGEAIYQYLQIKNKGNG